MMGGEKCGIYAFRPTLNSAPFAHEDAPKRWKERTFLPEGKPEGPTTGAKMVLVSTPCDPSIRAFHPSPPPKRVPCSPAPVRMSAGGRPVKDGRSRPPNSQVGVRSWKVVSIEGEDALLAVGRGRRVGVWPGWDEDEGKRDGKGKPGEDDDGGRWGNSIA